MLWLTFQPQNPEHWACRWFVTRYVDPNPDWRMAPKSATQPGAKVLGPTTRLKGLFAQHGHATDRTLRRLAREVARAALAPGDEKPTWAAELAELNGSSRADNARSLQVFDALFAALAPRTRRKFAAPEQPAPPEALALQRMPVGLLLVDRDGTVRFANQRAGRELALPPEKLAGVPFSRLPLRFVDAAGIEFKDQARILSLLLSRTRPADGLLVAVGEPPARKFCMLGTELLSASDAEGDVLVTLVDVTRQLLIEHALRAGESRISALIHAVPHGILECSTDGLLTFANAAALRMCSRTPGDHGGLPLAALFAADTEGESLQRDLAAWLSRGAGALRTWGRTLPVEAPGVAVQLDGQARHDHTGALAGFVLVLTDICERRRLEQQMRQELDDPFQLRKWMAEKNATPAPATSRDQ